jgi:hypothetical protein
MDGVLFSHTERAPPQLPRSVKWYGGFVDPSTGSVFDQLGRAYLMNDQSQKSVMRVLEF